VAFKEVDGHVEDGQQKCDQSSDAGAALDESFVALDTKFELAQAAGLSVTDERMHFGLEHGQVSENLFFKISHKDLQTAELRNCKLRAFVNTWRSEGALHVKLRLATGISHRCAAPE
jgi:hypothetical protein